MLLRLDAADRLVRAVGERGRLGADEAARLLFCARGGPPGLLRALLVQVVEADARLAWDGSELRLADAPLAATPLEAARFCVVDLETSGVAGPDAEISEIGAVLLVDGKPAAELELTGSRARGERALARLFRLARGAVLAGHNLRFDLAFIDRASAQTGGTRVAATTVDTLVLARRLLRGRVEGFSLASLAEFVGSASTPCHRALPDARATADVLLFLVELARERGARTVGDLAGLARPSRSRGEPSSSSFPSDGARGRLRAAAHDRSASRSVV